MYETCFSYVALASNAFVLLNYVPAYRGDVASELSLKNIVMENTNKKHLVVK